MTNEQSRQEAIQIAYRSNNLSRLNIDGWQVVEYTGYRTLSDNGYEQYGFDSKDIDITFTGSGTYNWRPKSLRNIETNNGWTRIEPDGSNLPTDDVEYKFIHNDGNLGECNLGGIRALFKDMKITHYKQIKEEPKPIY